MKSLIEFITETSVNEASTKKYLNSNYYFLYVPEGEACDEAENYLGLSSADEYTCQWNYWVLDLDELIKYVKESNISKYPEGDIYMYAVKKSEWSKLDSDEVNEIVNEWDHDIDKFNNWPALNISDIYIKVIDMKSLKEALISKSNRDWASASKYKYLNGAYVFLYIPEDLDDISEYINKNEVDEDCEWVYFIFDLKELIEFYNKKGVLEDSDYIYAIDKKEYKRIAGKKLREILNPVEIEDFDDSESFNGWPRIDGALVADLSKKLKK